MLHTDCNMEIKSENKFSDTKFVERPQNSADILLHKNTQTPGCCERHAHNYEASENVLTEELRVKKFKSSLGLSKKAGALTVGVPMVLESLRKRKAVAVIHATDVSENTLKKLRTSCEFYKTPLISSPLTMDEISSAVGLLRLCGAVAVTDEGLYKLFEKLV